MPVPFEPSVDLGLIWRAITLDDIDIWHELVGAIEDCDKPSGRLDRDDLIDELTNGSYKDPARNTLIGIDARWYCPGIRKHGCVPRRNAAPHIPGWWRASRVASTWHRP